MYESLPWLVECVLREMMCMLLHATMSHTIDRTFGQEK
jgi:hypothetical protein